MLTASYGSVSLLTYFVRFGFEPSHPHTTATCVPTFESLCKYRVESPWIPWLIHSVTPACQPLHCFRAAASWSKSSEPCLKSKDSAWPLGCCRARQHRLIHKFSNLHNLCRSPQVISKEVFCEKPSHWTKFRTNPRQVIAVSCWLQLYTMFHRDALSQDFVSPRPAAALFVLNEIKVFWLQTCIRWNVWIYWGWGYPSFKGNHWSCRWSSSVSVAHM
jgi:hypothetical protein